MKYLIIAVSLLLLSACSMPLLALAQQEPAPEGFGPGPGGAQGLPPFLHGIALSEAQQDKVFADGASLQRATVTGNATEDHRATLTVAVNG